MTNTIVSLNQQLKRVNIGSFELENEIVFSYFDKLPVGDRDNALYKAIYIGVLAMNEDRLSTFLSKTKNELGTELESLKILFDMKQVINDKTTFKGVIAEDDVVGILNKYFSEKNLKDRALTTGTMEGKLPNNKTGDIVCSVDGNDDIRIAIEVKFDGSITLGNIESKNIFTKKQDTAYSQILEARINREGKAGIIVFDRSNVNSNILKYTESVGFINGVGFVAIIDSQKGDYKNLFIAYTFARQIVLNEIRLDFDDKVLTLILKRIIKDIETFFDIKKLVQSNIENNKKILEQLEKSLLLMEFNHEYLSKFLKDGKLSERDLFDFYSGEAVKKKFTLIETEIKSYIDNK